MPGALDVVDETPGLLDLVAACEQRRVACHGIEYEPLVCLRAAFSETGGVVKIHFHRLKA